MGRMGVVGVVALVCALAATQGTAHSATFGYDGEGTDTVYVAGPGEANSIEITHGTVDIGGELYATIQVHDYGANITPGDGCDGDGGHFATCLYDAEAQITLELGDLDDKVRIASTGRDVIRGGAGNDSLRGDAGNDVVDGGAGDDELEDPSYDCSSQGGSLGADVLIGGTGRDRMDAICRSTDIAIRLDGQANDGADGEGDDYGGDIEVFKAPSNHGVVFVGDDGPNEFRGNGGPNVVDGRGGDDRLYGGVHNDVMEGGAGNDVVEGFGGGDQVSGGPGADALEGEGGSTVTDGTGGPDTILARDGERDTIACGTGADSVQADAVDVIAQGFTTGCEAVDQAAAPGPPVPPPAPPATRPPATTVPGATATGALSGVRAAGGRRRITLHFTLDRAATLKVRVTRAGRRKALGTVTRQGRRGPNTVVLRKVGSRTLVPGRYRVTLILGDRSVRTLTVRVR